MPSTGSTGPGAGFDVDLVEERPGFALLAVEGRGAAEAFAHEAGGHRWQRIPPTEKRGRVHTSTVTVAVMLEVTVEAAALRERDIDMTACRGSGAGGQARNKTSNVIQATHRPTGLQVRVESSRSQAQNRAAALALLAARLDDQARVQHTAASAADRRRQVGSGQRGDKVRTIRVQDNQVTHHPTDRRVPFARYERGDLAPLWA